MILSQKATSIIESIVVMMIIVSWITWMYLIYQNSIKLSESTKHRIEAIEIAREWIEAVKNIRETNWLIFWADYTNCWNTLNYDQACVWDTLNTTDIPVWSYIIYKWTNNRWYLDSKFSWIYSDPTYRTNFEVYKDNDGLYTQSWAIWTHFKPLFTREIQISYPDTEKIKVTSKVQWADNTSAEAHTVEINEELTNRKK